MSQISGDVECYCGKKVVIRTSWTNDNPGRRFQSCRNGNRGGGCGFFAWEDPPMCHRATLIIPGLLRRINEAEAEIPSLLRRIHEAEAENKRLKSNNKRLKSNNKRMLKLIIVMPVVFFLVCWICKVSGVNPYRKELEGESLKSLK